MNTRDPLTPRRAAAMPDVQATSDFRRIAIDHVGIKSIRHPVRVSQRDGGVQHSIALLNMYVGLPHDAKGVHMSRFVEMLNASDGEMSAVSFLPLVEAVVQRLEAESGRIEMSFPYFIRKRAPVSGVQSLMDYEAGFTGEVGPGHRRFGMNVVV